MTMTNFILPSLPLQRRSSWRCNRICMHGSTSPPVSMRASTPGHLRVKRPPTFQRLLQRLATIQDRSWQHKLPSILCVLSTACISLVLLGGALQTSSQIQMESYLRPLVALWATATAAQSVSGVLLTVRYRTNQPDIRFAFLTYATANFVNAFMGAYTASLQSICITVLFAACIAVLAVLQPLLICTKVHRKPSTQPSTSSLFRSFIVSNSAVPLLVQIPILLTSLTVGINLIYPCVANAMCVGFAAFATTIEDRRIIANNEQNSLLIASSLASVAVFVSLITVQLPTP